MSATTLLGRKKVEDLGFICAHEHLRMNFECSFHKSKLCSEDTNMKLKNMTNHQAAMVRQFPYHFKDNLDLTDYDAVLYDLKGCSYKISSTNKILLFDLSTTIFFASMLHNSIIAQECCFYSTNLKCLRIIL